MQQGLGSSDKDSHVVDLKAHAVPPGWMIGPRSYLVDRIVAGLEHVHLPAKTSGGGQFTFTPGHHVFAPPSRHWLKEKVKPRGRMSWDGPRPIVDLRVNSPENWAHFLNNHLAVLALICRTLESRWDGFTLVLPGKTPGYIRAVAEVLELDVFYSDAAIEARGIRVTYDNWVAIRGERHALLRDARISPVAAALEAGRIPVPATPGQLFLSRKSTRGLANEDEIATLLSASGFEKIYPEDMDVAQQIGTVMHAQSIVAVHGAALAPILYRSAAAAPLKLVELFPVGHVTDVYRAATSAIAGHWCGVRGKLQAEHLREIYRLDQSYKKHSLQHFEVDPASVTKALEIVDAPQQGT
ncbi:DUF563 domain-containing protein [uncultured Roseobacter sp.]|uniref:glycosyltransferase family 61 protein n=1 Tax=uncultured Roseobacter sp. TaxID=114847 RepID=UPI0026252CB2|nr:glycosyltransferase family 61 protein [uncultured Roseobacter sp.]